MSAPSINCINILQKNWENTPDIENDAIEIGNEKIKHLGKQIEQTFEEINSNNKTLSDLRKTISLIQQQPEQLKMEDCPKLKQLHAQLTDHGLSLGKLTWKDGFEKQELIESLKSEISNVENDIQLKMTKAQYLMQLWHEITQATAELARETHSLKKRVASAIRGA